MSRGSVNDGRQNKWRFQIAPGNAAQLVFPSGHSDAVRIAISKADTKVAWAYSIKSGSNPCKIRASGYVLTFRAKADRLRNIVAAVSKAT